MILDVDARLLCAGAAKIPLSHRECRILEILARGSVVHWDNVIIAFYQGEEEPQDARNVIKVTLHRLKKKAGTVGIDCPVICRWGTGLSAREPIEVRKTCAVVTSSQVKPLADLLYSHPDRAAADRVLASLVVS